MCVIVFKILFFHANFTFYFVGNSHAPSEIVKAIMHRFSQNELRRMESMENLNTQRSFKGVANTILAQRHFLK